MRVQSCRRRRTWRGRLAQRAHKRAAHDDSISTPRRNLLRVLGLRNAKAHRNRLLSNRLELFHQALHSFLHLVLDACDTRDADEVDKAVGSGGDLLHAAGRCGGRGKQHQLQAVLGTQRSCLCSLLQWDVWNEQAANARCADLGDELFGAAA